MDYFLREYSLSWALLLLGAWTFHGIAFSLLLRSPRSMFQDVSRNSTNIPLSAVTVTDGDPKATISFGNLSNSSQDVRVLNMSDVNRVHADGEICQNLGIVKQELSDTLDDDHAISKKPAIIIQSNHSTFRLNPQPTHKNNFKTIMKNILDFSLMKNVSFILCAFYIMLMRGSRVIVISQIVSAAISKGHSARESAYIVTVMGFSNIVFRIISAVVLNLKSTSPLWFSFLGVLCLTATGFLAAFAQQYTMFVCGMLLLGAFEGE